VIQGETEKGEGLLETERGQAEGGEERVAEEKDKKMIFLHTLEAYTNVDRSLGKDLAPHHGLHGGKLERGERRRGEKGDNERRKAIQGGCLLVGQHGRVR